MFNAGLIWKYKTDRPLTKEERELQLKQRVHLNNEPADQLALIAINSTYLESLDKYFPWKGWLTTWMLVAMALSVWAWAFLSSALWSGLDTIYVDQKSMVYYSIIGFGVFFSIPFFVCVFFIRKEVFRLTHYPIRLNRKSRMVYVFRLDGTVLAVPWDDIFFTLGRENSFIMRGPQFWEIQGHVLAEDGVTVKETFAFHDVEGPEIVRRHWEFLRRYMEDGPEDLVRRVQHYSPVDRRNETFGEGLRRIFANDSGFLWAQILAAPVNVLIACGRWIAMRTSKIPQWPAEVEAACQIVPNDPYAKDARAQ